MSLINQTSGAIAFYVVDAFTDKRFTGNPAAVVLLDRWLTDKQLQAIAAEFNLSETAFLVGQHLRWFTPKQEVNLCGHATLATAHVLRQHAHYQHEQMTFQTHSGMLNVFFEQDTIVLNFPAISAVLLEDEQLKALIEAAIATSVMQIYITSDRYVCYLQDAQTVAELNPNRERISALPLPGLVVTAIGQDKIDFVCRYFAPAKGIVEDPVTGTAHCVLAPLWGKQLNKSTLVAQQLSQRGGQLICEWQDEQVRLKGKAKTFSMGSLFLD